MNQLEPFRHAAAITPSDANDLSYYALMLVIGTGGALKVTTISNETVTLTVPAGQLPLHVKKVFATGTTATGITALW